MESRYLHSLLFFYVIGVLLAACGGSSEPMVPVHGEDVTGVQMAGMMLPQEIVATEFSSPEFHEDVSGFFTSAHVASSTIDPDDTANDIESAGWLDGYRSVFSNLTFDFALLLEAKLFIESDIKVFRDSASAREFLLKEINDFERFHGVPIDSGSITSVELLEPPALGEFSMAMWIKLGNPEPDVYLSIYKVGWVRGPILASIGLVEPVGSNKSAAIFRLAQRMDERMDQVMLGDIVVEPLPRIHRGDIGARKTELATIQRAVSAAMVDNRLSTITPVASATNDMTAFPDTTWNDGATITAPDTAGVVLYNHDNRGEKADDAPGWIRYVITQTTKCKYLVTADGTVSWADTSGNPTDVVGAADCS